MAEAFYNGLTNSKDSWSAGLQIDTPKKYKHPTQNIVDVMKEVGIDISKAKVKYITKEMLQNSKLIVVMCKKSDCPIFVLNTKNIEFWKIDDPFYADIAKTKKIRNTIKQKVLKIIPN